jgi:hypothetical protein
MFDKMKAALKSRILTTKKNRSILYLFWDLYKNGSFFLEKD